MNIIDYYDGDYMLLLMIICYCNKANFSSSIYKVIRPVLNFLLFFFTIRFHKHQKALKSTKSTINILFFFRIRFYIKCRLQVNLVLFTYIYFYLKVTVTVKKNYHDGFNS